MALGPPVFKALLVNQDPFTTYGPTATVTATPGDLLLVGALSYAGFTTIATPSAVSGLAGLRWVRLVAHPATVGNGISLALWGALVGAAVSGGLSVTYPLAQRGCLFTVAAIPAVSRALPVRLDNVATSVGTGTGATSTLLPLAAPTHYHVCALAHQKQESSTVGTGFALIGSEIGLADVSTLTEYALNLQWKVNDATCNPTWPTNVPYVMASCEIQEAVLTAADRQTPWFPVWLAEITV